MCYTDLVGALKQNVTLVLEEDLLLSARRIALDRKTSVNQLVREFLANLVAETQRKRMARSRLRTVFEKGLVEVGDKNWTRDELYER
jgi:hypothetical protein